MAVVSSIGHARRRRDLERELSNAQHRVEIARWVLDCAVPPNDGPAWRANLAVAEENARAAEAELREIGGAPSDPGSRP